MIKIAHIADTHIRNLKYHYEYKIVFSQIYETLKNEKVDYIVHCGDIASRAKIVSKAVKICCSGLGLREQVCL